MHCEQSKGPIDAYKATLDGRIAYNCGPNLVVPIVNNTPTMYLHAYSVKVGIVHRNHLKQLLQPLENVILTLT